MRVRLGTYVAIGFGETMTNTEMVYWAAHQLDEAEDPVGMQKTYFATGHRKPLLDEDFSVCYTSVYSADSFDKDFY